MVTRVEVTFIRHFDEAISGRLAASGMKSMSEAFERWLESIVTNESRRVERMLEAEFGESITFDKPLLSFTHAFERPTTTGSAT